MKAQDKINKLIKKYNLPESARKRLQKLHLDGMKEGRRLQKKFNKINKL